MTKLERNHELNQSKSSYKPEWTLRKPRSAQPTRSKPENLPVHSTFFLILRGTTCLWKPDTGKLFLRTSIKAGWVRVESNKDEGRCKAFPAPRRVFLALFYSSLLLTRASDWNKKERQKQKATSRFSHKFNSLGAHLHHLIILYDET